MQQFFQYAGRLQGLRGNLLGLPPWARLVLYVFAAPGILALLLSVAAVLCSLAALLLVTVPVYRILRMLTDHPNRNVSPVASVVLETPGRRHVDVRIVE